MGAIRQTIVAHLWFDKEAVEAARFYVSIFRNSRVNNIATLHATPSGTIDVVAFELCGQEFMAISAGPLFKFNEAVSFVVKCDTQAEIDSYWDKLTGEVGEGGVCGWLKDKYGLFWQIVPAAMEEMLQAKAPKQARPFRFFICG
jgi:predicted 3-demethylubiquinone-9 3-methyltransferase (glyoxalase superfamily)